MIIKHIFRNRFFSFSEKQLIFQQENPKPAPAAEAEKNEVPGTASSDEFAQKWDNVQKQAEQELEASLDRINANQAAVKKPEGPRGQAIIGEVTYADASGVHKLNVQQPKSKIDKEAEELIAELDKENKKTLTALATGGVETPETKPIDMAALDATNKAAQKPKLPFLDRLFGKGKEKPKG